MKKALCSVLGVLILSLYTLAQEQSCIPFRYCNDVGEKIHGSGTGFTIRNSKPYPLPYTDFNGTYTPPPSSFSETQALSLFRLMPASMATDLTKDGLNVIGTTTNKSAVAVFKDNTWHLKLMPNNKLQRIVHKKTIRYCFFQAQA